MTIHIVAHWTVTLRNVLGGYKLFRGAYVLHFQGSKFGSSSFPRKITICKPTFLYSSELIIRIHDPYFDKPRFITFQNNAHRKHVKIFTISLQWTLLECRVTDQFHFQILNQQLSVRTVRRLFVS